MPHSYLSHPYLKRHGFLFATVFAIGLLTTALVIVLAPRTYRSQAMLLLKIGRESISIDPTAATSGQLADLYRTKDNEVTTAYESMLSREIIESVVDAIGEKPILSGSLEQKSPGLISTVIGPFKSLISQIDPLADRERAIIEIRKNLEIEVTDQSSVVKVTYLAKNPELAHRVASEWVDAYLNKQVTMNSTSGSLEFFDEQREFIQAELATARANVRDLKSQFGIVTVQGEQLIVETQMQQALILLDARRTSLAGVQGRIRSIETQLAKTEQLTVDAELVSDSNDAHDDMQASLFQLEIEQHRLSLGLLDSHPQMQQINERVELARKALSEKDQDTGEVTRRQAPVYTLLNTSLSEAKAESLELEGEVKAIETSLAKLKARKLALNEHELQLGTKQQKVIALERQFHTQEEKHEQARLVQQLERQQIGSVNVIQKPSLEHRPVTPNKMICLFLGLFGTTLLSSGLCVLRELNFQARLANDAPSSGPYLNGLGGAHNRSTPQSQSVATYTSSQQFDRGGYVIIQQPSDRSSQHDPNPDYRQ